MRIPRPKLLMALVILAAAGTLLASSEPVISPENIARHVQFLASDDLGGRAPGSPGETKAIAYLTDQLKRMGCAPGNPDGTYLQKVPMYGYEVTNAPSLTVHKTHGSGELTFASGSQFVGWTLRQVDATSVKNADLVFVGYGVDAPEYKWNDYKTDVKGKIVVMLVNDPPLPDESMFGGKAMTYYGRWTYKFEEAAEKGAAGAILVHNTEAAGYPWEVVENSWSGEQFDVVRADKGKSRCAFESWVTEDAARTLFQTAGRSFDDDKRAALSADFKPVPMGLVGSVTIKNRSRTIESNNVVGLIPGTDPDHRDETIIYSAHWDHLGVGKADATGDSIYNGALDNASGDAGILEIARAFARRKQTLLRSVLFLFTTGEESGLLGSTHYTEHPLYPLAKTIAEINVDGVNIWGRTTDMVVVGYGQSNLDQLLAQALVPMGRTTEPDSEPEKGYYYRSDHFPFAKKGVPALYSDSGVEFRDRPAGWGMEKRREYVAERYHKPADEYSDTWDLSGAAEDMEALFVVGYTLATTTRTAEWSETSEFRRAREEMLHGGK